jgi:hypothetical protein
MLFDLRARAARPSELRLKRDPVRRFMSRLI